MNLTTTAAAAHTHTHTHINIFFTRFRWVLAHIVRTKEWFRKKFPCSINGRKKNSHIPKSRSRKLRHTSHRSQANPTEEKCNGMRWWREHNRSNEKWKGEREREGQKENEVRSIHTTTKHSIECGSNVPILSRCCLLTANFSALCFFSLSVVVVVLLCISAHTYTLARTRIRTPFHPYIPFFFLILSLSLSRIGRFSLLSSVVYAMVLLLFILWKFIHFVNSLCMRFDAYYVNIIPLCMHSTSAEFVWGKKYKNIEHVFFLFISVSVWKCVRIRNRAHIRNRYTQPAHTHTFGAPADDREFEKYVFMFCYSFSFAYSECVNFIISKQIERDRTMQWKESKEWEEKASTGNWFLSEKKRNWRPKK